MTYSSTKNKRIFGGTSPFMYHMNLVRVYYTVRRALYRRANRAARARARGTQVQGEGESESIEHLSVGSGSLWLMRIWCQTDRKRYQIGESVSDMDVELA